jgi:hypothetical protein
MSDMNMNIVFNYLSFLFGYCAIGLEVLSIIFILMMFLIPSKRYFLGSTTVGILFDVLLALVASYAMAPPIQNLKKTPLIADEMWGHYILFNSYAFIFTLFYIFIRLHIYSKMTDRKSLNDAPMIMRVSHTIQYLFPCTIAPLIFIISGILAIWGLLYFLLKIIIWPLGYSINREQSLATAEKILINTTLHLIDTTNITKKI